MALGECATMEYVIPSISNNYTGVSYAVHADNKKFVKAPYGGGLEHLCHSLASRKRRRKREPSARGYNWATLFLGDINMETWPSRFGESQMRQ
jgi:hypothetical protein